MCWNEVLRMGRPPAPLAALVHLEGNEQTRALSSHPVRVLQDGSDVPSRRPSADTEPVRPLTLNVPASRMERKKHLSLALFCCNGPSGLGRASRHGARVQTHGGRPPALPGTTSVSSLVKSGQQCLLYGGVDRFKDHFPEDQHTGISEEFL